MAAQVSDALCKQLHTTLSNQPTSKGEIRVHKEYKLKQNRIYRVTPYGLRWVVPKTARTQVVFYHHDSMGHLGAEKTLQVLVLSHEEIL
jgi:hypothetical protein